MRKLQTIGVVLPLLILPSCADIQEYPKDWPKPVEFLEGGCSAFVGIYSATDHDSQIGLPILAGSLDTRTLADRVEITAPTNGILNVVAYRRSAVVVQRQYSEREKTLSCGSMEAVLTVFSGMEAGGGAFGYSKEKARLSKDSNGFLILKRESSGIGAFGFIPIVGTSTRWLRFRPYVPGEEAIPK